MRTDRGAVLTGLGLGAALMYFLDPARGRRRRARVRDQAVRVTRAGSDAMEATSRDVANRVTGAKARVQQLLRHENVDDDVLVERVRAQLGRAVSHPRAVTVRAADGVITVAGPILQSEVQVLLRTVKRVRGVRDVVSALEEHAEPGNIPALQSGDNMVRG